MAVEMETGLSQEPIVRHYRGVSREDVEAAYGTEAEQAGQAGFIPVTHQWTTDWQGFLLAVTYRQTSAAAPAAQPVAPQARPALAAQVAPSSTADEFAPSLTPADLFAQAEREAAIPAAGEAVAAAPVAEPVAEPAVETAPERAFVAPEPEPVFVEPEPEPVAYVEPVAESTPEPDFVEPEPEPEPEPVAYAEPEPEPEPEPTAIAWPAIEAAAVAEPVFEPVDEPDPMSAIPAPEIEEQPAVVSLRQSRLTVQTMDLHCAGEPLRIVRSGFPDVPSLPVLERREWVQENADHVRKALMQEPRGHRDMYGAVLLPPYSDYADMTVLFMHNEGYSTMCGHGVIAITTGLIEEGLFPATEPVTTIRYEVPAGIVAANAATVRAENGDWAVQGVRFTNVPSYVAAQSLAVKPDGVELHGSAAQYGALNVDLAFGGAYYGIVNAAELGLRVVPEQAEALRHAGAAINEVLRRDHTPAHPTDPALGFVYGTIIVDLDPRTSPDGKAARAHMRNATIFANAELDRSPCGSGTSAILAQLHARGRIKVGQEIVNAGITGEHFLGRVEAETALGPYPAVSTSIAGTAYVTGFSTFIVDSRDPLGEGFLLS